MTTNNKKKLMVIVGAGASIELGMPSVKTVDELFTTWAKECFQLAHDEDKTLYCYIRDEINRHYSLNPMKGLKKETNFEEVLYIIFQLSSVLGDGNYNLPINAFFGIKKLPKIKSYNSEQPVDGHVLRNLSSTLIDKLVHEFREKCKVVKSKKSQDFKIFEDFIKNLSRDYDVAFITLNYDNLITQACPELFTGFSPNGSFEPANVYRRTEWGLIYHLHGSVHFDMQGEDSDLHAIKWNSDLHTPYKGNASGRNYQATSEGISMPTSAIVAGYGKMSQIQRWPFRTYYSRIDDFAITADAFLFMGYGFNDLHLNSALYSIRNGSPKRPVVVIDWAVDKESPMVCRNDGWANNLHRTVPYDRNKIGARNSQITYVEQLKAQGEFEVSKNPDYPLSIWYGGLIEACKNYSSIKSELDENAN